MFRTVKDERKKGIIQHLNMVYHEIPNKLTPLPEKDFILMAAQAWESFYNKGPEARQLTCCLAQMVLESARKKTPEGWIWGSSAHNYNWGNIKHNGGSDPHSWQYYKCGEELLLSTALKEIKRSPGLIYIVRQYKANGKDMASVMINPPHPWCRFRAYETAVDGTKDYIEFLVTERTRYLHAWNFGVMKGDPAVFARELGEHGYYTAPIPVYTKLVSNLFKEFQPKVVEVLQSPEGQLVYAGERAEEKERLINLVKETIDDSYESIEKDMDEEELRATLTPNIPSGVPDDPTL